MKFKLLLTGGVIAASTLGFTNHSVADSSVTIAYGERFMQNSSPQTRIRNYMALRVRTNLSKNFDGDIGMSEVVTHGTNNTSNRVEVGLTYNYRMTEYPVRLFFRSAVGEKTGNGEQFPYYAFTPGVQYNFKSGFDAGVSYRYRDAFNPAEYGDRSNTMSYSVGYNVTKKDKIAVIYSNQTMDGANKQTVLAYTRKF